jgi:CRP-like cAMP-binding protein
MTEEAAQKIETFFGQYRLRRYTKGQVLILNGDGTDYIYHLVKGRVKVYDVTYRGDEIILNIFKPPAFFPMSMAINKTHNPYVYEAETDIAIHQVPADEAVVFVRSNPDVLYDLLSRVYRGIDGLLGRMAHFIGGSAKSRVLYELLVECRRFGQRQSDGSSMVELKEADLAARAGLTRETISREMRKLERQGEVQVTRKGILVRNIEAIENKLGANF